MAMGARRNDWHDVARTTEPPTSAWIGGRYAASGEGATFTRINPATGELLATITEWTVTDVDRVVDVAMKRVALECGGKSPQIATRTVATPFGGYKQSGIGRDRSLHAFDKYTEMKTTWLVP